MRLRTNIFTARRRSGATLIECIVYVAVFAILLGIGTASFYLCWDHTRSTIFTADEIESALRVGEAWRADMRAATGTISIETMAAGQTVKIPQDGKMIIYRFTGDELWRDIPAQNNSRLLLAKIKTSAMKTGARDNVTAWRWDVELTPRRKEPFIPLRFTFEAAQTKP